MNDLQVLLSLERFLLTADEDTLTSFLDTIEREISSAARLNLEFWIIAAKKEANG